ncbi:MAG: amino acid ABC transporter permease, partial [Ahrensia sp.]
MVDRTNVTAPPENVGPSSAFVRGQMIEAQPAPISSSGLVGWVRANLFPSVSQGVLTVICLYVLYLIIPPMVSFLFTDAVWSGADRTACATEGQGGIQPNGWFGACWAYVGDYTNQFIYGRYPDEEQWRVNIVAVLMALAIGPLLAPDLPYKGLSILYAAVIFPVAALVLLTGGNFDVAGSYLPLAVIGLLALAGAFAFAKGSEADPLPGMKLVGIVFAALFVLMFVLGFDFGLERVNTEVWGGLLVTMVIAVTGIAASLPIGILLALGRRSQMPIVKFV